MDTIGGFNSMIEKQKRAEGEALISTVLFDNESEVLQDRVKKDIKAVPIKYPRKLSLNMISLVRKRRNNE